MKSIYKFKNIFYKIITLITRICTSFYDGLMYYLRVSSSVVISNQLSTGNVLYIGENFPPRIARMVKWLKRTDNMNAVLVCHRDGFSKKFINESFDNIILFRNVWHLYRILKHFRNVKILIYAFGPKTFYADKAREFLSDKKFIYDMQDVLCIYYGINTDIKWFRKEFVHERNCLTLADGIVSHGLEPIAAKRIYGIKKAPPLLYFPLYCDNDFFENSKKVLSDDDIHIVYAGEIHGAFRDSKQFGNVQFHWLINELSRQKIHFHGYPSPANPPMFYEEYKKISEVNEYFHLHKPVAQHELSRELSKYHFGIIPFFKTNTGQSDDKYRYSTALKLFNFIEAGIPVLVSEDITFQSWLTLRYKAGISISKKDVGILREIIKKTGYEKIVNDLLVEREKISLKANIKRLSQFIKTIGETA